MTSFFHIPFMKELFEERRRGKTTSVSSEQGNEVGFVAVVAWMSEPLAYFSFL